MNTCKNNVFPLLNFDFDGFINKEGDQYGMNFYSNVNSIDLYKLGMTKVPWVINGNIKLDGTGKDINSFVGNIIGENIVIAKSDSKPHKILQMLSFAVYCGLISG